MLGITFLKFMSRGSEYKNSSIIFVFSIIRNSNTRRVDLNVTYKCSGRQKFHKKGFMTIRVKSHFMLVRYLNPKTWIFFNTVPQPLYCLWQWRNHRTACKISICRFAMRNILIKEIIWWKTSRIFLLKRLLRKTCMARGKCTLMRKSSRQNHVQKPRFPIRIKKKNQKRAPNNVTLNNLFLLTGIKLNFQTTNIWKTNTQ